MSKLVVEEDHTTKIPAFHIMQLVLNTLCVLMGAYALHRFLRDTTKRKTYFYYTMALIAISSIITSFLYYYLIICEYVEYYDQCGAEFLDLMVFLWVAAYAIFFGLVVAASFKYAVLKSMDHYKLDFQPFMILTGLVFFLGTATLRIIARFRVVVFFQFVITAFLLFTVILDATMLILLLRKLRLVRQVCVKIPIHIEQAYHWTKYTVFVFAFAMIPSLLSYILLDLYGVDDTYLNFIRDVIHFFFIGYTSINLVSMILIKKLAEVEDCSSEFFGLDTTKQGQTSLK